jgi:hypothetical protein
LLARWRLNSDYTAAAVSRRSLLPRDFREREVQGEKGAELQRRGSRCRCSSPAAQRKERGEARPLERGWVRECFWLAAKAGCRRILVMG